MLLCEEIQYVPYDVECVGSLVSQYYYLQKVSKLVYKKFKNFQSIVDR